MTDRTTERVPTPGDGPDTEGRLGALERHVAEIYEHIREHTESISRTLADLEHRILVLTSRVDELDVAVPDVQISR